MYRHEYKNLKLLLVKNTNNNSNTKCVIMTIEMIIMIYKVNKDFNKPMSKF